MNSIVNIIAKYFPDNWDKNVNTQNPYRQINVSTYLDEFDIISEVLRKAANEYQPPLRMLERVQNVYAYGQFLVREQFFSNKNPDCYRVRRFYVLQKRNLEEAIKYNLDSRRIDRTTITFSSRINFVPDDYIVLIVQVLTYNPNEDNITPQRSSDYFVEYVAYFD